MKTKQRYWSKNTGWQGASTLGSDAHWVLVFGGTEKMAWGEAFGFPLNR